MLLVHDLRPDDWPALAAVLAVSFNHPGSSWDVFRRRIGDEGFRVASLDGAIVGGLGVYTMAQTFCGRPVGLGGIAGVGAAPHVRGKGVARALVVDALRGMRDRGLPLAGLYPATQTVYRTCDFEQSGVQVQYEVPLPALAGFRMTAEIRPVDPRAPESAAEIARRYRAAHGNLVRSPAIWERILCPVVGQRQAWLVGDEGYMVLTLTPPDAPHFDLDVVDLHAPSREIATSILALWASHRSLADHVRWYGAPVDPLLALVAEPCWKVNVYRRWMLRIVDVDAALRARGWTSDGELHLDVDDAILPENSGRRVLHVRGGVARVEPGGRGDLRLPIRSLGPLYSGLFDATALRALGWLDGDDATIHAANAVFRAETPWMREMY